MTREEFDAHLKSLEVMVGSVLGSGNKEYAHADNVFANFEGAAADLGISREGVLWVYLRKHLDGIRAWINGHRSQRESVRGRIKDAIAYLSLLDAMAAEGDFGTEANRPSIEEVRDNGLRSYLSWRETNRPERDDAPA